MFSLLFWRCVPIEDCATKPLDFLFQQKIQTCQQQNFTCCQEEDIKDKSFTSDENLVTNSEEAITSTTAELKQCSNKIGHRWYYIFPKIH